MIRFRTTVKGTGSGERQDDLRHTLRLAGFRIIESAAGHAATSVPWHAISDDMDAQDTKTWLRRCGFRDREFQIRLEYQRAWGCL